jgi:hypothetical protein
MGPSEQEKSGAGAEEFVYVQMGMLIISSHEL